MWLCAVRCEWRIDAQRRAAAEPPVVCSLHSTPGTTICMSVTRYYLLKLGSVMRVCAEHTACSPHSTAPVGDSAVPGMPS